MKRKIDRRNKISNGRKNKSEEKKINKATTAKTREKKIFSAIKLFINLSIDDISFEFSLMMDFISTSLIK